MQKSSVITINNTSTVWLEFNSFLEKFVEPKSKFSSSRFQKLRFVVLKKLFFSGFQK